MVHVKTETPIITNERIVLAKFDGEIDPHTSDYVKPLEVIVLENGELVDHWTNEEERPWPTN